MAADTWSGHLQGKTTVTEQYIGGEKKKNIKKTLQRRGPKATKQAAHKPGSPGTQPSALHRSWEIKALCKLLCPQAMICHNPFPAHQPFLST